jgi:hypothetical protein
MRNSQRAFSILLFNLLLLWLLHEANGLLAGWRIHLHGEVLFVIFSALYLRVLHGATLVMISGLFIDVYSPFNYGLHAISLLLLWTVCVVLRQRVRRENPRHVMLVAIVCQLIHLPLWHLAAAQGRLGEALYWLRGGGDLLASLLFVGATAYLWCEMQRLWLLWLGWNLNAEMHRLHR